MTTLVVKLPFADYAKGQEITDPVEVAAVLDANAAHVVVRAEAPPEPAPPAKPGKGDPKASDPA